MKEQPNTKKGRTEINLHEILALPHEEFLPQAFCTLMGREPDPLGVLHYASRLQKRVSRTQIVVEMRTSPEGRAQASAAPCPELDAITQRYLLVKKLPFGIWRWRFLPRLEPRWLGDEAFHWEQWAAAYIKPAAGTSPPAALEKELHELQAEVERLRTGFRESAERLAAQGTSAAALAPLQEALNPVGKPSITAEQLPWVARSIYQQLLQLTALRA